MLAQAGTSSWPTLWGLIEAAAGGPTSAFIDWAKGRGTRLERRSVVRLADGDPEAAPCFIRRDLRPAG